MDVAPGRKTVDGPAQDARSGRPAKIVITRRRGTEMMDLSVGSRARASAKVLARQRYP